MASSTITSQKRRGSRTKGNLGKDLPFLLTPILHLISSFQMNYFKNAERLNGLAAMIGIAAALGAYALTGQIIPGVW